MLADCALAAFVPTTDAARALPFYRDVLGLSLLGDDGFALTFAAHGATLRLVRVEQAEPVGRTIAGWRVANIEAAVRGLVARGVVFLRFAGMEQDALGIWTPAPGSHVAWFADPDGNVLSLSQSSG